MNEAAAAVLLKYSGFSEKEVQALWERKMSFTEMWRKKEQVFSRTPLGGISGEGKILKELEKKGISYICPADEKYPEPLRQLNPIPVVLFYQGNLPENWERALGMVGTRRPSGYGRTVARNFARRLSEAGLLIVSGLARGIDAEVHLGALDAKQPTVGILGCGLDVVYPSEHKFLYEKIRENGCLLSTFLPGAQPEYYHFPERNRILAGLCRGICVIEAPMKSGAMITAKWAAVLGELTVLPAKDACI